MSNFGSGNLVALFRKASIRRHDHMYIPPLFSWMFRRLSFRARSTNSNPTIPSDFSASHQTHLNSFWMTSNIAFVA